MMICVHLIPFGGLVESLVSAMANAHWREGGEFKRSELKRNGFIDCTCYYSLQEQ